MPAALLATAKFRTVFAEYYPRVFAFLYAATLDFQYSRELTLVVFLRAIEESVPVDQPLRFFELAREAVLDRWLESPAESMDGFDQSARRVLNAVSLLQPSDRELLSLRFDAGLTDAEIAAIVHIGEDDVRSGVSRALGELRSGLSE